mgnify:CR=1 FL=1
MCDRVEDRDLQPLLTVKEVAALLNTSVARVYDLASKKVLPVVKLGRSKRFDPDVLRAWIKNGGQALPGGWRQESLDNS